MVTNGKVKVVPSPLTMASPPRMSLMVVGCGTKWEGAGHEAAELLILPDDESPLRVSKLDATAAGLVGAAACAF